MKKALIVGGTSGLGLSIALNLSGYDKIIVLGRHKPEIDLPLHINFCFFDITQYDYSLLDSFSDIQTLIITAGIGRLALFEDIKEQEIIHSFEVNTIGVIRLIKYFYKSITSSQPFYCSIIGSIAGSLCSPFFSVYGASKAALKSFTESLNTELMAKEISNRILLVAPGAFQGTKFNGNKKLNIEPLTPLAIDIIERMYNKETFYIPNYEETYKRVLTEYNADPIKFGLNSYKFKQQRLNK